MKSRQSYIAASIFAALCFAGSISAKDKRNEITILPGGAHVFYDKMEPGKTSAGKDALVFTGGATLTIHRRFASNAIWASARRIDAIPLALQYNVFGPGKVHVDGVTYESGKPGAVLTFFQTGRLGQYDGGWHKT